MKLAAIDCEGKTYDSEQVITSSTERSPTCRIFLSLILVVLAKSLSLSLSWRGIVIDTRRKLNATSQTIACPTCVRACVRARVCVCVCVCVCVLLPFFPFVFALWLIEPQCRRGQYIHICGLQKLHLPGTVSNTSPTTAT